MRQLCRHNLLRGNWEYYAGTLKYNYKTFYYIGVQSFICYAEATYMRTVVGKLYMYSRYVVH